LGPIDCRQMIRVLVVDDHTIVRDGICALLALTPDIEVVGEASDGNEALEKVQELTPDVVIMDMGMPVMGGLEATRRIRHEFPNVNVLVLTQYDDREYVFPAIEAGALGFIIKTAASSDLAAGIRSVHRGDSFLSPSVAKLLVESHQSGESPGGRDDLYALLTGREKEVLKLTAEGHTLREIAEILIISPKTVEGHKTNLMTKLNVHNRTDLIKYAVRKGIISV
jgi:DNA-binding NarL/FixJ family response regulator